MARNSGRPGDELAWTREMLDSRYDDLKSGKVEGIDGEEVYRHLMQAALRREPQA